MLVLTSEAGEPIFVMIHNITHIYRRAGASTICLVSNGEVYVRETLEEIQAMLESEEDQGWEVS